MRKNSLHLWGQILIFSTCAAKGKRCLTKETYDNLPVAPGLLPALACWESPLAPRWLHKCCALHEEVLCYLQKSQMNIQIKPLWILRAKKKKKVRFLPLDRAALPLQTSGLTVGVFLSFSKYPCIFKPWWDLLNSSVARHSLVPSPS